MNSFSKIYVLFNRDFFRYKPHHLSGNGIFGTRNLLHFPLINFNPRTNWDQILLRFCSFFVPFFPFFILISCDSDKEKKPENTDLLSYRACFSIVPITRPLTIGDSVRFDFEPLDSTKNFDSVVYQLDGMPLGKIVGNLTQPRSAIWFSGNSQTGTHIFSVAGFSKNKPPESASQTFLLKSDTAPENFTFEIVKTFPHDPQSFTQGLEWYEGRLYEGTGLNGKSSVMEVDLKTGKSIRKVDLEQEFFGEGITVWGNQLFQITWKNKKGFVYDLPDLKKVKEFGYPTDGWGLTHLNQSLVMSDGSNKIYFLDATNFSQKGKLEVWDNKNSVSELNELEAIDGAIFANKYTTDTIVKIDPKSGKVLAYIHLEGILSESEKTGDEDVLNGIAWQKDEKLIYVTGKNWPKIFAIRLVKKQNI